MRWRCVRRIVGVLSGAGRAGGSVGAPAGRAGVRARSGGGVAAGPRSAEVVVAILAVLKRGRRICRSTRRIRRRGSSSCWPMPRRWWSVTHRRRLRSAAGRRADVPVIDARRPARDCGVSPVRRWAVRRPARGRHGVCDLHLGVDRVRPRAWRSRHRNVTAVVGVVRALGLRAGSGVGAVSFAVLRRLGVGDLRCAADRWPAGGGARGRWCARRDELHDAAGRPSASTVLQPDAVGGLAVLSPQGLESVALVVGW